MSEVICSENVRFVCLHVCDSERLQTFAVHSITEVHPHEKISYQNWLASYVEFRENIVLMNVCDLDCLLFTVLPNTGAPMYLVASVVMYRLIWLML